MLNRFEQFTAAISSLYRFIQKIERDEMEKYGLKGASAQYLLAMERFPEGITAAELCDVCDKDKSAVSRILAEMEAKGLIRRESDNDSQYRARLTLTDSGREAAGYVQRKATVAVELAGQGLSDGERKVLYSSLELIANNIKTISHKGIPDEE